MSFYARMEALDDDSWTTVAFDERDEFEPNLVCSYRRLSDLQNLLTAEIEGCQRGSMFPVFMSYVPGRDTRIFEREELALLKEELKLANSMLGGLELPYLVVDDGADIREVITFGHDCLPLPLLEGSEWSLTLLRNGLIRLVEGVSIRETTELSRDVDGYSTAAQEKVKGLPDLGSRIHVAWCPGAAAFEDLLQGLLNIVAQAAVEYRRVVFS